MVWDILTLRTKGKENWSVLVLTLEYIKKKGVSGTDEA